MSPTAQRLSPHLGSAQHSETLLINELSKRLVASNQRVYQFGFGENPFPVPEHIVSALRESAHRKEYLPVQGLAELRHRVADFHTQVDQHHFIGDQIVVGAGSKILIYCLMAAIKNADIALVTPSWVSYEPQAKLAGHQVLRIQTEFSNRWKLTPETLDHFCLGREFPERPLMLILNYPGNPDGDTYSSEELEKLAVVLRRHHVFVISDEIYGLLDHRGEHTSLARFYPEGTIVTTGMSKWCGAGGWRLGIAHIPEAMGSEYLQRVVGVASETYSCVSTPVQYAALAAYTLDDRITGFLGKQRTIFSDIGRHSAALLQGAGVRVRQPRGGFYLFPDFSPLAESLAARGITTGVGLTEKLLAETGVALLPGSAFGMDADSLTARLAYVDFDGAAALRTGSAEKRHLIEGIETLCEWLLG